MRVHHALRVAGGARGEEHRRHVLSGRARGDLGVEEARVRAVAGARPASISASSDARPGFAVVAQAARVVVPDARELRALRRGSRAACRPAPGPRRSRSDLGVVDREDELGASPRPGTAAPAPRRATARPASTAYRRGRFSPTTTTWSSRFSAGLGQAAGQLAHQRGQLGPGDGLPDAVFLLAQRRRRGALGRVVEHQAGKGRRHCGSPVGAVNR